MITFSAPGKIHLLGEHSVVYGKPALLVTVNLRVNVILSPKGEGSPTHVGIPETSSEILRSTQNDKVKQTIESIIKKHLKLKTIPAYKLEISSQIPTGCGLGSSAAISAAFIAALLTFLKVKWDLNLINQLTFEAEKHFHGNPSGGDNSTVVFGGLILYTKGGSIQPLPFSIPSKLTKNLILINTGQPKETTAEMVKSVRVKFKKIFDSQEQLTKQLLEVIKHGHEEKLISIIKAGERNLEKIGVVSPYVKSIIRKIEKAGGAAKICGGGGKTGPTGILLCYHLQPSVVVDIAKSYHLDYFKTALGVEGLKLELSI